MANMNLIVLIGRVVGPPELRYTPGGKAVASFAIAVDRRRGGGKDQQAQNEVDFIPIVAWERLAEICNEYLVKGKLISIQGSLRTRSYETQDGQKRKAFEVVANEMQMLSTGTGEPRTGGSGERSSAPRREPVGANAGGGGNAGSNNWGSDVGFNDDVGVDDIPF